MSELKPCPFCGSVDVWEASEDAPWSSYVRCEACDGRTGYHRVMEDAIQAWNRRAGTHESETTEQAER